MFNSVIVTVAGGHIDSVDTVVNPVITSQVLGDILGDLAGHVSGDVLGNVIGDVVGDLAGNVSGHVVGDVQGNVLGHVAAVVNAVTASQVLGDIAGNLTGHVTGDVLGSLLGHVAGDLQGNVAGHVAGDVLGNVAGDIVGDLAGHVTGDVIGNLLGHVAGDLLGNVVNPVQAGSGSIDFVTTDVPLPFRDIAFWPCVPGESFPPTFSAGGASYTSTKGLPVVVAASGGGGGATWPFLPRVSFANKQALTLSGKYIIGNFALAHSLLGINPTLGTAQRRAQFEFFLDNVSGLVQTNFVYADGTTATTVANVIPHEANGIVHSWSIELTATGSVIATIDGVVVVNAANVWPPSATDTPYLAALSTNTQIYVAALEATWS